jgi:GT2 family glycosyltransferase
MITMDRRDRALQSLDRLAALPERPPVIVVDHGSADGTAAAVAEGHPDVTLLALRHNHGAAGRNIGVAVAATPYVAFSDDDSWWDPGALPAAAAILDRHPEVGLVAARMLVGSEGRSDPVNELMADSPLRATPDLPYPHVLGFLACGAVVRRSAFLDVGGFDPAFGVGGEEELLALDLAAQEHRLVYAAGVTARHHPAARSPDGTRARRQVRNHLWVAWMRLPVRQAFVETVHLLRAEGTDRSVRRGVLDAALGCVRRRRRPAPPDVLAARRMLRDGGDPHIE